ncbi:MAG: glycine--tRNA ligase subunit beta, partial [Candidatus Margulisbacteria bacterium]|nr:glycine--tRNA ligase subunit beta [Candidatus Margulisiibacteriota bacterium]
MANNALLEIGCEEIPARFMPGFLVDLKAKAEEKLAAYQLAFSKVETLGTYRRLTLVIEGLPKKQPDQSFEAKGPPAKVAFDREGKPTPAAVGFAKKQGVAVDDLELRDNYVFAQVEKKGETTAKVLKALFPEIIEALFQPLAMRWGSLDFKFIRPIHWIVALLGSYVVKFEIAEVKSGGVTQGHRYAKLKIKNVKLKMAELLSYKKQLAKLGVIVDQEERRGLIHRQVEAVAKQIKARVLIEDDLLDEVTFLVENPIAYLGSFDKSFLGIPAEVLVTSMKKNQKYFPVLDKGSNLLNKFVVVTDGCKNPKVVEGNEKVLAARLSDAKFFFDEDQKVSLKDRLGDLEKVGFFAKLGMMSAKVERIGKLAELIGKRLHFSEGQLARVKKIAVLSKSDLTTKMVYEFPTLQGIMGRHYAALSGEDQKVAEGIFEHYLPRFAGDELPKTAEGAVVGLADRLDTLVGCFSIGAEVTGSADPYGLRRAANGVIRLILGLKLDLLLDEIIEHAYKLYSHEAKLDAAKTAEKLLMFIAARLKPALIEENIRYDVVDAVLVSFNDILDSALKAQVINGLVAQKWFAGVVASADRIKRIAKDGSRDEIIEA